MITSFYGFVKYNSTSLSDTICVYLSLALKLHSNFLNVHFIRIQIAFKKIKFFVDFNILTKNYNFLKHFKTILIIYFNPKNLIFYNIYLFIAVNIIIFEFIFCSVCGFVNFRNMLCIFRCK